MSATSGNTASAPVEFGADGAEVFGLAAALRRQAYDFAAGGGDPFGLRDRSGGVVRVGIGHRLDTDQGCRLDSGVSYLNGNGFPPAVPGQRIAKFLHVAFKFFAKLRNSAADSVSLIQIRDGRWVIFSTTTSSFSPEWGAARPAAAKELGIRTLGDLLYYFPFRYIDRSRIWRIGEIADDSLTYIQLRTHHRFPACRFRAEEAFFIAVVADGSGTAELVWFKGINWIEKRLEAGREYIIFGRPAFFNGALNLVHPEVESVLEQANRFHAEVQGVYSTTEKLNNGQLGTKAIYTLMCNLWPQVEGHLRETLPGDVMSRYGLVPLRDALYNIHFPTSQQALRAAEYRLKFEELFGIQLNILREQRGRKAVTTGFCFRRSVAFLTVFTTKNCRSR